MSDTVIRVENLGKKYIIGHQKQQPYTALRDVIADGVKSFSKRVLKPIGKHIPNPAYEEFWALKDVSFEIKQGDVVGIIGRNGAGKSTLLKILSRITEPSTGRVFLKGRVASLLEVGTGFHPELTGRENIYLNGAVLGMTKNEIKNKFDEIVAFAEVEKFLDTPVKRYSSGMYVRLAFAVAAHLEPEVLVVDEVLAVGDAQFQKKCLGKMGDVANQEGRTVLFVSHNMAAIRNLCKKGVLLESGLLVKSGFIREVIEYYVGKRTDFKKLFNNSRRRYGCDHLSIVDAAIYRKDVESTEFEYGDNLEIKIKLNSLKKDVVGVELIIKDELENPLIFLSSGLRFSKEFNLREGENEIICYIPEIPFAQGRYYIDLIVGYSGRKFLDYIESALYFDVIMCDPLGTGNAYKQSTGQGSIHVKADFYCS